jgi:predicted alpha/beta-hydrolase family hydrolase
VQPLPHSRQPFEVALDGDRINAQVYTAGGRRALTAFVLAHGAGAGQFSSFIVRVASGLAGRGIEVVTFDFPYMQQGKRVPDRAPKLESSYRAVISEVIARDKPPKVFIGGKSLGGRIASHLAAADDALAGQISGLICLGYPLHPPGARERLRDAHLPRIRSPVLIVQGERDAFGSPDEIRSAIRTMSAPVDLLAIAGGDHSLSVPKRGPVTQEEIYRRVEEHIASWMAARAKA